MHKQTDHRDNLTLLFFVFLFLALRLFVLATGGMKTFGPEELLRGTLAKDLITGLKIPLFDYQADHYSGGSLVAGVVAVPFFLILGPNLFALKLSGLTFALFTLISTWVFLKRFFGFKEAFFAATLFILAPPAFVQFSLITMGYHSESILFSSLILYFFYRYFFGKKSNINLFLFGLSSGLGFWFIHTTLITIFACLAAWSLLDIRSLKRKSIFVYVGGAFLGALPWILFNLTHRFQGVGFILKFFLSIGRAPEENPLHAFAFSGEKLFRLIFTILPMSFGYTSPSGLFFSRLMNLIYFVLGLIVLVPIYSCSLGTHFFKKSDEFSSRFIPLLLLPIFFILCYWLSAVDLISLQDLKSLYNNLDGGRYFVPFHYYLILLLGISCVRNRWGYFAFVLFCGLGLYAFASISFQHSPETLFRYKGYSYSQMGTMRGALWPRHNKNFTEYLESLNRYEMPDRYFVFLSSLHGLQFEKRIDDPEMVQSLMDYENSSYQPQMAEGVGMGIGVKRGLEFSPDDPILGLIPGPLRPSFYMGFFTTAFLEHPAEVEDYFQYASKLAPSEKEMFYFVLGNLCPFDRKPGGIDSVSERHHGETEEMLHWFFRGIGIRIMISEVADGVPFPAAVSLMGFKIPPEYEPDIYWGCGWSIRLEFASDRQLALEKLKVIPQEAQESALKGFIAAEKAYALPN